MKRTVKTISSESKTTIGPDGKPKTTYKSEIDADAEFLDILDGTEFFIRIMKFKTKPGGTESLAKKENIDLEEFTKERDSKLTSSVYYTDGHFNQTAFINIFKAIRSQPEILEIFENLGRVIELYKSPVGRPFIEALLNYEEDPVGTGIDILSIMLSQLSRNKKAPGGRSGSFFDDIEETIRDLKNSDSHKKENSKEEDNCPCPGCTLRRAFGIPKQGKTGMN
jgi:hypothetical protein